MKRDLELNKQNAIAFYRTAYLGNPSTAVEEYVGSTTYNITRLWLMVSRLSSFLNPSPAYRQNSQKENQQTSLLLLKGNDARERRHKLKFQVGCSRVELVAGCLI